jgi:hypothetical protein
MFGMSGGNLDGSGRGGGVVITGCGCSPIGILLSIVLSALGTLLANVFLRRRM